MVEGVIRELREFALINSGNGFSLEVHGFGAVLCEDDALPFEAGGAEVD
jgi:hypothetical protein